MNRYRESESALHAFFHGRGIQGRIQSFMNPAIGVGVEDTRSNTYFECFLYCLEKRFKNITRLGENTYCLLI